ncbi:MAG TPA: aldo/keto reductase [Cyclobacteriaceae bacterium]|nr:aldo/keto reductase [Cyclobacteriaceae bacterium]
MKTTQRSGKMKRREFVKKGVNIATAGMFMGFAHPKLFGRAFSPSETLIEEITLNNGIKMPVLGFGTLYLRDDVGVNCVAEAISLGYRLIDTAKVYENEKSVGGGIRKSGIDRKELFVTSKLWVDDSGYEPTKKAFQVSLDNLGLDYLDLYLIHRPRGDVKGAWIAMEELYKEGKIRAIGVSNFEAGHLDELLSYAKVKPAVNQIETHSFFQQEKANQLLKQHGIRHEAWSPFAQGRNGLFTNETLAAIGKKYKKSNAQVSLRWHVQRGITAIPRSSQKSHMAENLDIFDFVLDESDLKLIASLDKNITQFPEWE